MKINLVVEDVELKDLPLTVTVANPDLAKYVMREFDVEESSDECARCRQEANSLREELLRGNAKAFEDEVSRPLQER